MDETIKRKLQQLEKEHNIKILLAVESGSRAWGFSSGDSDYDIRFIYVHKLPWYLSITENRDVIEEVVGDLDLSGWELSKALKLLSKGNPPLLEWLNSPIVYIKDPEFYSKFNKLAKKTFNNKAAIYHYLNMAKGNYKDYIQNKAYVKLKKYLYVIRPLLSCIHIQKKGTMAPVAVNATMKLIRSFKAYSEIQALLEAKRLGAELSTGVSNPILNDFIDENIHFFELYAMDLESPEIDYSDFNKLLLRQILEFTNGSKAKTKVK